MHLIVGLGNPGLKYARTRHNFGFQVVNAYAAARSLSYRAGKGSYLYSKVDNDLLLVKPTTYMNNSGMAVSEVLSYFKESPGNLLLVYDDIDLPLGTIRYRETGSSGGHRGVESVITQLGTADFHRLRLGIASDENMKPSEKYVLKTFNSKDEELVLEVIHNSLESLDYYLGHSIKETMNKFNKNISKTGEIN